MANLQEQKSSLASDPPLPKKDQAMRKVLQLSKVNKKIVDFQYAVRGAQSIRADELKQELEANKPLPFKSIISCNIGNPQQLGQEPITFYRQVTALIEYPPLMESKLFPPDAISRAKELLKAMGGSCGAYSNSQGVPLVRERIAKFIQERDGYPANPKDIFLTAGASPGVQTVMNTLISGQNCGVFKTINVDYDSYSSISSI
jgi:aspartate/methionine/tyrosine aminotransferase